MSHSKSKSNIVSLFNEISYYGDVKFFIHLNYTNDRLPILLNITIEKRINGHESIIHINFDYHT